MSQGMGKNAAALTASSLAMRLPGMVLILTLLPRCALPGYVFTPYVCEMFNFTLSAARLKKVLSL